MAKSLGLPKLRDIFTEQARAGMEIYDFYQKRDDLVCLTPPGDGRGVLVLPGFGAGDASTSILRSLLKDAGYNAHGWKQGVNLGPGDNDLRQMAARLDELFTRYEGQKITLIGHSLGGVFARELARAFPDKVDQVITLGAPFGADEDHSELSIRVLLKAFHLFYGGRRDFVGRAPLTDHLMEPLPIPTTAIYSQNDGVVNWRQCINNTSDAAENIEVGAGHIGLIASPKSMAVILDRLNQKPGDWKKFDPARYAAFGFPAVMAHEAYEMLYRPKRPMGPSAKVF